MDARLVTIILSDSDLQGFQVIMKVDETTTENYLINYVMGEVSEFLVRYNLINIIERLYSKTLHIHNWIASEIYMETELNYHVCSGCADTMEDDFIPT
jgi:hypothetical protein